MFSPDTPAKYPMRVNAFVVPLPLHELANDPVDVPGYRDAMSVKSTHGVSCPKNGNIPIVAE